MEAEDLETGTVEDHPAETFDQMMNRLEELVVRLERGQSSLEDDLKHFEAGVRLLRHCQQTLSQAEQRVNMLVDIDETGQVTLKDFAHAASHQTPADAKSKSPAKKKSPRKKTVTKKVPAQESGETADDDDGSLFS